MRKDCSIHLSGKKGTGMELDALVESKIVLPFKEYVSGNQEANSFL